MWSIRFEELKTFKEKHGDCLVPQRYPPNPQLGTWVNTQRRHYRLMKDGKHSSMNEDRVQALEDIGFIWATSRGAPPLKKRSGKQEVEESTAKKKKLDAYDIAARRFPGGESPSSQKPSLSSSVTRDLLHQGANSGSPNTSLLGMQVGRDALLFLDNSSSSKAMTSKPSEKKLKSRWICDVCHVATFNSFEDAYAHESKCKGLGKAKD
mmetsp:Transcript_19020/g.55214  ORF Transcript_19020/g.55214 Transcript_19020/m.55214 type:complete len:208 (-) Transcript_19020:101-724(-)